MADASGTSSRATRGRLVAEALRGISSPIPPPLRFSLPDLEAVTPVLLACGGGALASWRVSRSDLSNHPVAEQLKQAYRLHMLQAEVHERQLEATLRVLRSAGVEALLAKGWAAARLYPEPGLRPYGDIDLYVRPECHDRALSALTSADTPPGPVDLHRGFSDLDDRSPEELFARARRVAVGDQEVRLLGAEDHLRLLCLHALRHGAVRPLWLCDVAIAVERRPDDFDWDRLLSGDRRRADYVVGALGLARTLLGACLESTPLADRTRALPRWLIPAVLNQWGTPFEPRDPLATYWHHPSGFFSELLRHWPNGVEATVGVRGPFNQLPRLPFQLAHALVRTTRFSYKLLQHRATDR